MSPTRIFSLAALPFFAALARPVAAQPTQSVWEAASGLLPTQVCPAWTLVDTAAGADPTLGTGGLSLATGAGEDMLFLQSGFDPVAPDPFVIEARMRFVSGTSAASNRAPAAIVVTAASNAGVFLGIGADEIFLTASGDVRGQSATVDTDGAAHTYHIEVTSAGAVTVLYDGVPTLTGTTYTNASVFGAARRLIWGEGADEASGSHVWESFKHNAATCPTGTTTSTTLGPPTTLAPTTTTTTTLGLPTTSSLPVTSSSLPPGPSTTSTTVSARPTTTTTLPPASCDEVEPGSLAAMLCRLDVLADRIGQVTGLGQFRPKLQSTLQRAIARADDAASACTAGDTKTANRRMKQTAKFLQKMAHRLSGLSARKKLDASLRADLLNAIASIRTDVNALRRNACANP